MDVTTKNVVNNNYDIDLFFPINANENDCIFFEHFYNDYQSHHLLALYGDRNYLKDKISISKNDLSNILIKNPYTLEVYGFIGLYEIDSKDQGFLHIYLKKEFRNKKIGINAIRLFFIFLNSLKFHYCKRIILKFKRCNFIMNKICKKLKFKLYYRTYSEDLEPLVAYMQELQ